MPSSPVLSEMIKEEILDGDYSREPAEEGMELNYQEGTDTQGNDVTEMDSAWNKAKEENDSDGENNLKRPASTSPSEDEPSSKKRTNEVDKLWKNVNDNPNDFQAWTLLLQHIDQVSDLESGREAYDGFFARYPYCYGYWKKYADLERRKGTKDTTLKSCKHRVEDCCTVCEILVHLIYSWRYLAKRQGCRVPLKLSHLGVGMQSSRAAPQGNNSRYSLNIPALTTHWHHYQGYCRSIRRAFPVYGHIHPPPTFTHFHQPALLSASILIGVWRAIRLSVDLWLHYMEYITVQYPDDELYVRQEFERAIDTCGLEFKILATPTSKYMHHWQKFQDHVKKHLPSEIVGVDEFLSVRRAVLSELNRSDIETPDEAPPGVEAAPGDEQVGTNVDEETKALQRSIISARQKIHEANAAEVKALWSYEDAIKRPYFHVKPLEKSQLSAWRNYLEYEIKQAKEARIRVLFERCLIACALYEEFWMRYVRYLEEVGAGEGEIRAVYHRACDIHLRDKFRPHLSWAAFEEENDGADRALQILADVQERVPGSLEAWMQAAGVERRRNNTEAAKEMFMKCLAQCQERDEKDAHSHVSLKLARFCSLFEGDKEKAVEILKDAHEYNKSNSSVLLALVDHSLSCNPPQFKEAEEALKEGIESCQSPGTRLMFAHRLFHFMSECGQESNCVSEGLRILREVQHEVRQMDSAMVEADTSSTTSKQGEASSSGISVIEPRRDKRNSQDKTPASTVNGTSTTSSQSVNASYQNYAHTGYGNYNQGYTQGYGTSHYQGWGYPTQQGGYGYGQQGWGAYGNYYGQR
ncbi:pre-mRNA-processing factor 39-like [Macrobrachium nipponense]|uniref:pre-mRNA-processing factor 39-like n=1 Tax=Macrobrachium nipponense TaxID=159736 RepID=UPI0030C83510